MPASYYVPDCCTSAAVYPHRMDDNITLAGLRPEFCSHSARVMSFKTKRSMPKASRWPHPPSFPLTPDVLAAAGYFHDPADNEPDRTTCWMCAESMKGWTEDDDPWTLHMKWSPKCFYARIALLEHERDTQNPSWSDSPTHSWGPTNEWFPRGPSLIEARLATFCGPNGPWKHEGKKGIPTRVELARAGFHFTPNLFKKGRKFDVDDTTSCCYCHRSVTEWEVDDDPVSVHLKKGACIFFTASQPSENLKKSAAKPTRLTPNSTVEDISQSQADREQSSSKSKNSQRRKKLTKTNQAPPAPPSEQSGAETSTRIKGLPPTLLPGLNPQAPQLYPTLLPIATKTASTSALPKDPTSEDGQEKAGEEADPASLLETENLLHEYLGRPDRWPIADGWLPNPYNPSRPFPPLTAEEAKMPLREYFAYRANQEEEAFLEWVEEKQMKPWLEAVQNAKDLLLSLIATRKSSRQSSRKPSVIKKHVKSTSTSVEKENDYNS